MAKFTSITKVLTAGVLTLGLFGANTGDNNVDAKEKVRVAPIAYVGSEDKGLYFEDYTVQDFEKEFLVTNNEAKKLKLKKKYEFNKPYIAYFKNEIDVKTIHEANEKTIVRKANNKFVYSKTGKTIKLNKAQYADLKGVKKAKILIDKENGKKVLKFDYSFVTKTYQYKVTKVDSKEVHGKALNYKGDNNSDIFLDKKDLKFKVSIGDKIAVKYGQYGDIIESVKKIGK